MNAMKHEGWSFACGWAARTDAVFFARERDDLSAQGVTAASFYLWNEQYPDPSLRWAIYDQVTDWRAQGMAAIKTSSGNRVVAALGTKGQYYEVEPATAAEHVGASIGPKVLVRCAAAISGSIFAAGMGRSVIRRIDRGSWVEFGPGTTDADRGRVVGFEGIDGVSAEDIYAVGWRGEIWHWSGGAWRQIDSPTNANLNAVACGGGGTLYAVGDDGSMVRGAGDLWDVVLTGRAENLQDVTVFENEVFVVTDYRILRLAPTGLIEDDRFVGDDKPGSCLHLLKAEDGSGVLSMGPKDLFAFSGGAWRRIV
jgi:hypothetical protein